MSIQNAPGIAVVGRVRFTVLAMLCAITVLNYADRATLAIAVRRILAEERVLMQDPAYRALAEKSRYRLLPFVF